MEKELHHIGELVLEELNIKLFNAEPTLHKAYQIYIELTHFGYAEKNKELACRKIKDFFKTRTLRNQHKEFYRYFGIAYNAELRPILALSLRTSEVDFNVVKNTAFKVHRIISGLDLFKQCNVDEFVLISAINELYRPKYYENEWGITLPDLFNKIKKVLIANGDARFIDHLEEAFFLIDPNPKKKKRPGLKLIKQLPKRPESEFAETMLTRAFPIKDSEICYIKSVLEQFKCEDIPEMLEVDLYQNDFRHPKVSQFLSTALRYNRLIAEREVNFRETLIELKIVVRVIKAVGGEVLKENEECLKEKVQALEFEIKRAG